MHALPSSHAVPFGLPLHELAAPQSAGQVTAVSPASHVPLPHTAPPPLPHLLLTHWLRLLNSDALAGARPVAQDCTHVAFPAQFSSQLIAATHVGSAAHPESTGPHIALAHADTG